MKVVYGLTLLELLVTISILVLVITLGAPSVTSIQKHMQLKGAAQNSYFAFQQARSSALANSADITIAFQAGKQWCAALSDSGVCNCVNEEECTVDDIEYKIDYTDFRFVSLEKVSFGNESVAVFDGMRGLSVGHAGSLLFSDGDKQLKLILSNMGRVRICAVDAKVGGFDPC